MAFDVGRTVHRYEEDDLGSVVVIEQAYATVARRCIDQLRLPGPGDYEAPPDDIEARNVTLAAFCAALGVASILSSTLVWSGIQDDTLVALRTPTWVWLLQLRESPDGEVLCHLEIDLATLGRAGRSEWGALHRFMRSHGLVLVDYHHKAVVDTDAELQMYIDLLATRARGESQ